jgi:hypothetical protein
MKICILVSALCALASVGLGDDVGVDTIVSPVGTIDSGQVVVPTCAVHAYTGSGPVDVHFLIPDAGYHDSLTLPPLPPGLVDTVTFTGWTPQSRDSMDAVAWLHCDGDTYPKNDTFRLRFFVRVTDIAVTQITMPQPDTTLDSGAIFYPQCRVWNFGNISLNFDVRFRISTYQSTRNLTLIAGGTTLATAPDQYTTMPGTWVCIDSALVSGDLRPENNVMIDTFTVRGAIRESLWIKVMMPDTVDTTTFHPHARVCNCRHGAASFKSIFSIYDSVGTPRVYADSTNHMLGPGDTVDVVYADARISEPGAYLAVAFIPLEPGGWEYADSMYFWVVPGSGVEEGLKPQASSHKLQATVVRGVPAGAVVFDAMGRRVLNPKPGVYFVWEQSAFGSQHSGTENGARSTVHVRKVILQR